MVVRFSELEVGGVEPIDGERLGRQQAEIFRAAGRGPAAAITGFLGRLEGAATRVGPRRRLFGILSPAGERGYDRVHKCPFTYLIKFWVLSRPAHFIRELGDEFTIPYLVQHTLLDD